MKKKGDLPIRSLQELQSFSYSFNRKHFVEQASLSRANMRRESLQDWHWSEKNQTLSDCKQLHRGTVFVPGETNTRDEKKIKDTITKRKHRSLIWTTRPYSGLFSMVISFVGRPANNFTPSGTRAASFLTWMHPGALRIGPRPVPK